MTATIGTSTNVNTEGENSSPISVGSTTAVTLIAAQVFPADAPRIKVWVYNDGNRLLWVRLYPASDDNIARGIPIEPGERIVLMEKSDIYTGEISAIMASGGARDVYVTWY